jgi:hypothetical protein
MDQWPHAMSLEDVELGGCVITTTTISGCPDFCEQKGAGSLKVR